MMNILITILVIAVVILVLIMACFLVLQTRLNAIIEKCCAKPCCCCCKKDDYEPGDECFKDFNVTYTTRQPPGATVPMYDIVISWNSGADLVDIEYQVARSGGWVKMGNQTPPEMFIDLPPSDTRTWTHVTGYAIIDCGEIIQIRGVCKSQSGAIIGYSYPPDQVVLPCP
jgi:hypothetical protein